MKEKVAKALNVFMNLNDGEKLEFLEYVKEFKDYPNLTRKNIQESLNEKKIFGVNFGPAPSSTCPYCGK